MKFNWETIVLVLILIAIAVPICYYYFPNKVEYEYLGCIDVDDCMDEEGYIPCRDDGLVELRGSGFAYYVSYYGLSPVGWQGVAQYNSSMALDAEYSSDISHEICFPNFFRNKNIDSVACFISWGRPIEKMWYQRSSKPKSNNGHYVANAVFADVMTEPKIYIYKALNITDIEPFYDLEKYKAYPDLRYKSGVFTTQISCPYQIFVDELRQTWDRADEVFNNKFLGFRIK